MSTEKQRQQESYIEKNAIKKFASSLIGNILTMIHNFDKIDKLIPISIRVKQVFSDKQFLT
jgi:iron-sulfur cluster repair protein YtfE (RIC family)